MSWSKIKSSLNSTVGTNGFKPLDKIVSDSFDLVVGKIKSIADSFSKFKQDLENGENQYIVGSAKSISVSTTKISSPSQTVRVEKLRGIYIVGISGLKSSLFPTYSAVIFIPEGIRGVDVVYANFGENKRVTYKEALDSTSLSVTEGYYIVSITKIANNEV